MSHKFLALTAAVCLFATPAFAAEDEAALLAKSLCAKPDQTIFTCANKDVTVSICKENDKYGLYSGTKEKPETLMMADPSMVQFGTLMYAGGGGNYLRFDEGTKLFYAYSASGKGWEQAGLDTLATDGAKTSSIVCDYKTAAQSDFFGNLGLKENETEGFEIDVVE